MALLGTLRQDTPCKICNGATELQGCVDAGRSCETHRGIYLPLTGVPIYYHRCLLCGFLFTTAFDTWSPEQFRANIYNDAYRVADPDYANGSRARGNAPTTASVMDQLGFKRVLDFGGGDGTLAAELTAQGYDAHSWDPIADLGAESPRKTSFDLVTSFEVFEHTPTPIETVAQGLAMLTQRGKWFFSTVVMDDLPRQSTDHWYIAPRNGHISIHSSNSLKTLFARFGWRVHSYNTSLHMAER